MSGRIDISEALLAAREEIAREAVAEFDAQYPSWLTARGEAARPRALEDAGHHVAFLAGAVAAGSPSAFAQYAKWACAVLTARGIASHFVVAFLDLVRDAAMRVVAPDARALVASVADAGIASARAAAAEPPATDAAREVPLNGVCAHFTEALLAGRRAPAAAILLEALDGGMPLLDLYVDVVQEALFDIGRRWEAHRISVAAEHTATAVAQFALAQVFMRAPRGHVRQATPVRRALIAGFEGELHQLGANLVADALEAHGWDVRFLGTNVPSDALARAVADARPDVVGLSLTMLPNLPKAVRTVAAIRTTATRELRIIVGGGAFRIAPDLAGFVGADGCASDVREALHLFEA